MLLSFNIMPDNCVCWEAVFLGQNSIFTGHCPVSGVSDLHFYLKCHSFNGFFTIINGANQESNFYINGKLTVKIQSVHKISESIIVEIDFSNTKLPGKRPSMAILTSKIWKYAHILVVNILDLFYGVPLLNSRSTPVKILHF